MEERLIVFRVIPLVAHLPAFLPRAESSCGVVIGDGSMNCVRYPNGFRRLAESVRRVLRDDGIFLLRCYVQPAVQERPEEVLAGISGNSSFHHFKLRLLMAMQQSARQGVAVGEVFRFWADRRAEAAVPVRRAGWERAAVETIELYRGAKTVHTFPTRTELQSALGEFFDEVSLFHAPGGVGERCPLLVLKPRRSARTFESDGAAR